MTTVIRPASDGTGLHLRTTETDDAINAIEEQLSELGAREEDTEWVVDMQSRRIVRRVVAARRGRG